MKKFAFIVRTGGGLSEKVFGMYSAKAEKDELSAEDLAEGHVAAPADNMRQGRKVTADYNQKADWAGKKCVFTLVPVTEGTPEYIRLYKMYCDGARNRGSLWGD